jgi:translation elongation factor EF-4
MEMFFHLQMPKLYFKIKVKQKFISVFIQIEETIGLDCSEAVMASAKEKIGIRDILEAVVKKVPPPKADRSKPLRGLIFDSWFDAYQGVVVLVRCLGMELH